MACPECAAPETDDTAYCPVCGLQIDEKGNHGWAREPEAAAALDLQTALEDGRHLLAFTRGRITGTWRGRLAFDPRTLSAPYANMALSDDQLVVQYLNARTGSAIKKGVVTLPLTSLTALRRPEGDDVDESASSQRLVVETAEGETVRLRVSGRFRAMADAMCEVWRSLAASPRRQGRAVSTCPECRQHVDGKPRFCPYCGHALEAQ